MKKSSQSGVASSLSDSFKALCAAIKSLYKLMPLLIITFVSSVMYLSVKLATSTSWMVCILSFVIVLSSLLVYFKSKNYGEAVLALSAGLLTVYTVNWTLSLFIGFITVWLLFTVVVFFIISVRLAAKIETIYIDCTVGLNIPKEQTKAAIKQLEKISGSLENSVLSPEERAEILRFFSFRKVSIENMPVALKWVHIYYVITKINYLDLASFVVAVIKNTYVLDEGFSIDRIFDYIYSAMRDTPVSPQEFIDAFLKTKYILAATQNTILYFDTLKDFFATNQPYDKLEDYVQQKVVIE